VREIVEYIRSHPVYLPGGARLSERRFQQLGISFGASNGFELVHYLIEGAFVRGVSGRELSAVFLHEVENATAYDMNPIYAILHESIYCQGSASNWSAERVRAEFPEFTITPGNPVYFTGEMIYPWMFDEYPRLRSLQAASELLAAYPDWPPLYDQKALQMNQVPCAAAVYYNDMYVERIFSEETAASIRGIRLWITDEHEHSALRMYGEELLDHVLGMLHGER
jgi:hypothetical protein